MSLSEPRAEIATTTKSCDNLNRENGSVNSVDAPRDGGAPHLWPKRGLDDTEMTVRPLATLQHRQMRGSSYLIFSSR